MTVTGSIFNNNLAGADGGAIIARRLTDVSYSQFYNNFDGNGYSIFNSTVDNISFSNNWWGSNNPDFNQLLNFNTSDDFKWIVMNLKSTGEVVQERFSNIIISFDEVSDKNNAISKLSSSEMLPIFNVNVVNGGMLSVSEGYFSGSVYIPIGDITTFNVDDQNFYLNAEKNPTQIIKSKDIDVDYSTKTTFKVRITDENGRNDVVYMKISGKTYKVKIDSKGYASKSFNLKPGKYTIKTIYSKYSLSNVITVKNVIKAKNITKKKSAKIKYSATLKMSNGKAIKNKKVSFKINGKTYKAKTNKNGKATVTFIKLKVGTYKITVKYFKCQVKTLLKVKK